MCSPQYIPDLFQLCWPTPHWPTGYICRVFRIFSQMENSQKPMLMGVREVSTLLGSQKKGTIRIKEKEHLTEGDQRK